MSSGKGQRTRNRPPIPSNQKPVTRSLYDAVQEGNEYESLVTAKISKVEVIIDIRKGAADIQKIRGCPLLIYAGNTVNAGVGSLAAITTDDDLPFIEMIQNVPDGIEKVDILIATPGGMGHQVAQFVETTRRRFSDVTFIVPHVAMSAGTIWILSGNDIIMDERAYIGPIDPQVIGKNGQFLPLQSLQVLVKEIQERGEKAIAQKKPPDWTDIHILQSMDPKELGYSTSASNYSIQLASTYLEKYKFRDWIVHSDGRPVTEQDKKDRALEIAKLLCAHDRWKAHSHGISRDVALHEVQLKITHPESIEGLSAAIRRLWSIMYYMFHSTNVTKVFVTDQYGIFRQKPA